MRLAIVDRGLEMRRTAPCLRCRGRQELLVRLRDAGSGRDCPPRRNQGGGAGL